MHRWAKCPGSVKLSEDMPNTAGIAAQEGTAAHEIIGLALDRAISENRPTQEVLDEWVKAIRVYSDYVEGLMATMDNPVTHVEHSFDMHKIYDNLYGTADCVVYDPDKKELFVIDYKHGKGIPVEVENNQQLSYYGLGALSTLGYPVRWVTLVIVQPRCYHSAGPIRKWRVPSTYFIDFKQDLLDAAKATEKDNAKIEAGSHCVFCPAKPKCEEYQKHGMGEFKKDFNFYRDPKKDFGPV